MSNKSKIDVSSLIGTEKLLDFIRLLRIGSGFLKNDSGSLINLQKLAILLGSEIWLGEGKFHLESVSCR